MFIVFLHNITLLISAIVVYNFIIHRYKKDSYFYFLFSGLLFGLAAILGMRIPFALDAGIIFDGRSIILGVSGLFGGPVAALTAAIISGAYRLLLGGPGVTVGVFNIVQSALLGVAFYYLRRYRLLSVTPANLLIFGILIHFIMIASFLYIPGITLQIVINNLALPVLLFYPPATLIISYLIMDQESKLQAEQMLRKSEERLKKTQEIAHLGSWEFDLPSGKLICSEEIFRIIGFAPGNLHLPYAEFVSLIHPAERNEVDSVYRRSLMEEKQSLELEYRILQKDSGDTRYVYTKWECIRINSGKDVRLVGMMQDITERKEHEEALKRIEWMLDSGKAKGKQWVTGEVIDSYCLGDPNRKGLIHESVDDATLVDICSDYLTLLETSSAIYEENGNYVFGIFSSGWCRYLNDASRKLCQTDDNHVSLNSRQCLCHDSCWTDVSSLVVGRGQIIDRTCPGGLRIYSVPIWANKQVIGAINFGYGDPPKEQVTIKKIALKYQVDAAELVKRAKAYESRPPFIIELAKKRLESSARSIGALVEQKILANALRSSEEKLSTLFAAMNEVVVQHQIVIDEGGDAVDYRIIDCNRAFTELTGISKDAAIGKLATDIYKSKEAPYLEIYSRVALTGEPQIFETYYPPMDKHFLISVVSPGKNLFATISSDITERKLTEETLRKNLFELEALKSISFALRTSMTLEEMLPLLLDETLKILDTSAGAIFLFKPELDCCYFSITRGWLSQANHLHQRPGESIIAQVLNSGEVYNVDDYVYEPLIKEEYKSSLPTGWCSVYLPIKSGANAAGVLVVALPVRFRKRLNEKLNILISLTEMAGAAIHRISLHEETIKLLENLRKSNLSLSLAYDATLEGWSRALDLRDHDTEGHSSRVADRTVLLAMLFNIPDEELVHIRRGSLLHDIGKVGIPDSVLLKSGKLSPEEQAIMKRHPQLAYDLLSPIEHLRPSLEIPYCHHERFDGSGYPRGLKGEEIPLSARIFAIVDVYDALTSDRPYRQAWSKEKTFKYISMQRGKQFDPQIVEAFLNTVANTDFHPAEEEEI